MRIMNKYTFICPVEGCSYSVATEADNDEEAKAKLFDIVKKHGQTVHPEREDTDQDVKEIVEENTQRVG